MKHVMLWMAGSLLAVPTIAAAQGQSSIEIVSINASPGTFQPGAAVSFSIEIKNAGTQRTRAGTAYLDIYKGERYLASEFLWGATGDVGRLDPGATTVVDFVWRADMRGAIRAKTWTVPSSDTDVFVVRAGILDPPNVFAQTKSARFVHRCSYARSGPIVRSPKTSATDLKSLKRSGS